MALIQEDEEYYERGGTQKNSYSADEVVEVPCPYCQSEKRERVYTEHDSIGVSHCSHCDLLYTSPRIEAPEAIYWGDHKKYEDEAQLIFTGQATHHRDPNYLEEIALIKRYKPKGRFLDVGCSMGMLLRHAREHGYETVGVEPSPSLSKIAREKWGLNVHNCFLHELPASEHESFDVIALSDVFEHISEPLPFLEQVSQLLAPNGILYIKVPNARWNLFKQRALEKMGKHPTQGVWDSYEHVVHYTDRSLPKMLGKAGFRTVRLTIGKPIQVPVWHQFVGQYYQYPSPWWLDWKHYLGRSMFYWLSWPERALRGGSIGALAPDIVAVARKKSPPK